MSKKHHSRILPLLLLLSATGFAQNAELIPKQLAGPPEEFKNMFPGDAIDSATHSKSALLPVRLTTDSHGVSSWKTTLPIDGNNLRLLVFSDDTTDWNISMRSPTGLRSQALENLATSSRITDYGIGGQTFPADYYELGSLSYGAWEVTVEALNTRQTEGFLLVGSDSEQRILSYQTSDQQLAGQRISFATYAYDEANEKARVDIDSATLLVKTPDSKTANRYSMFDDGLHNDGQAGDGVYGGEFIAATAGDYTVQVMVTGVGADNIAFIRTTEHLVPVVSDDLSLADSTAYTSELSDNRLLVNLPVSQRGNADKYHTHAEVWGRSIHNSKTMVPIAWIGGMSTVDQGNLSLGLDARWIARAEASAPFELRNVRIEDPDHFITVAESQRMSLSAPVLPNSASRAFSGVIDTEMLMGPAPVVQNRGVGSKLLLVHGYCSGNVWGPVSNQFSNAAIFSDFNQNRSHDQFAVRIANFGNTYNSYGIVAHSQGGAAATHLYTYYWSGLDNASGGRLIQSVGTPYQGTALAGNLAALGSVFGVGCGTNTDLTYNGAANWLAGIPSWARSQVNYYSTSFNEAWWRNDYCQIVTDLLLSDPEDGTTEKINAQLPGANNRGHVKGWCHTSGMRDPAQTTDSSRNSTMNAQAAR